MVGELSLQLPQLLLGEGGPFLPGLAASFWLSSILLVVCEEKAPNGGDMSEPRGGSVPSH